MSVLWQYLGALVINSLFMFFLARFFARKEAKEKKMVLIRLKKNITDFLQMYLDDMHSGIEHSSKEDYLAYKAQETIGYRYYLVEMFLIKIHFMKKKELTIIDELDESNDQVQKMTVNKHIGFSNDQVQKMIVKKQIAFFNIDGISEANIHGLQEDIKQGLFDGIILSVLHNGN